jgi:hypothetical protein
VNDFLNNKIHASSDDGRTLEIGNGNEMENNLASSGTTSKLELFIVCRLGKIDVYFACCCAFSLVILENGMHSYHCQLYFTK